MHLTILLDKLNFNIAVCWFSLLQLSNSAFFKKFIIGSLAHKIIQNPNPITIIAILTCEMKLAQIIRANASIKTMFSKIINLFLILSYILLNDKSASTLAI